MIRCSENPLVTPSMVQPWLKGYTVECTFNAGVAEYQGQTLLLLRVAEKPPAAEPGYMNVPILAKQASGIWQVETRTLSLNDPQYDFSDPRKVFSHEAGTYVYLTSISHLRLARSTDGIHFQVDPLPLICPDCAAEAFGTEDARITQFGDTYWINYTAVSPNGITTALATTKDFQSVHKHGIAFVTENRDVTIFPERIHGEFHALVRPVPRQIGKAKIWIARSPDLLHWGNFEVLNLPEYDWSNSRTGGGAVPIRVPEGWLVLYHGADRASNRYSMGAMLLDAQNPSHILAHSHEPVLRAEAIYEREGFYPNVVFSCGALLREGTVYMYYGAADRVIGLATATISEILSSCS